MTIEAAADTGKLTIGFSAKAEIEAASGDDPARSRPFKMIAYTGGRLLLPNYKHPLVVDLSGLEWPTSKLPIRVQHQKSVLALAGQTNTISKDRRQLLCAGMVMPRGAEAQRVVQLSDDGFEWQASIEAKLLAPPQFIAAGQTIRVNEQDFTGPIYLASKTRLQGIGFVELGADPETSAAIAASLADPSAATPPEGGSAMSFEEYCKSLGLDPATLTDAAKAVLNASYAESKVDAGGDESADPPMPEKPAAVAASQRGKSKAKPNQKGFVIEASQTGGAASLDELAALCANYPKIEASAIEGDWSVDQVRRAIRVEQIQGARPDARLPPVSFTNAEQKLDGHVIQASMLLASGMSAEDVGKGFERLDNGLQKAQREQVINCAMAPSNRITSFSGVFRRLLTSRGIAAPDSKSELFNEAIYANQIGKLDIEAAGGQTMVNLPGIFGDYMNKKLLGAYEELPSVIPEFCQEVDADDFKTLNNFRMNGIGGEMYELGTTGELKTVQFSEETWTNRLKTRGFMLQLPRELIINDDLQATNQIPTLIGRNSRRTRERIGFRTLLRAYATLFTSGHANLVTGAGSVMAANGDAIRSMITLQSKQKDANGDPVMIALDRVICGSTLGPLADDLYTRDGLMMGVTGTEAASTTTTAFSSNRVKGKLRPVISPFMDPGNAIYDTDGTTDLGSNTKFIGCCDPRLMALVQFVYLAGKRSPTVETRADASFNTLGMSWRCYWDINASAAEYRAGVGSDGA